MSPIEKAFFWPKAQKENKQGKIRKRITPTVATSNELLKHQKQVLKDKNTKKTTKKLKLDHDVDLNKTRNKTKTKNFQVASNN